MSLADRLKQRNMEREVAGKHPLIAMRLNCGTRDAYFRGIVLSAFLDDGKVDESERAYLRRIGLGLEIPDSEVEETISTVAKLETEDDQLALLDDISHFVGNSIDVVKLFLLEFSLVWRSHSTNNAELETYRAEIAKLMGVDIPSAFWKEFDIICNDQKAAFKAGRRLDGIGADAMVYLFPKYGENNIGGSVQKEPQEDNKYRCASEGTWWRVQKEPQEDNKYRLFLDSSGQNVNTVADLIAKMSGMDSSRARRIVEQGDLIATNLSRDQAMCWQDKLEAMGADVSMSKM